MSRQVSGTSRAWEWRHAVGLSGLPPITRLVLHTLGLKMDATGGSCFPPISEIVELSGLDKKTVLKHLDLAEEKGWIEIGQHGYRGQRWKRNEYVARWPGRDLTGEAASSDDDEGGGAVPPPFEKKVVELVPEGGGIDAHKVVEQLHQDKILPTNIPENSPAADAGESVSRDDRKKIEAAFWSLVKDWPNFATADKQRPLKLWLALSADERLLATQRYPEWRRTFGGRTHIPMPSTYLGEKLWNTVADPSPETLRPGIPNAWSKAWSALRLSELLKDPSGAMPTLTAFQRQEMQAGGARAEALTLDRLRNYGWPKVNTMHQRAQNAQGVSVPPAIMALAEAFVSLNRDSAVVARWKALHERKGWPWMPVPAKGVDWLFFPAGEPDEAIFEFQQAISEGRGNDDAA